MLIKSCEYCHTKYFIKPSCFKRSKYCSRKCQTIAIAHLPRIYKITETTREKMRQRWFSKSITQRRKILEKAWSSLRGKVGQKCHNWNGGISGTRGYRLLYVGSKKPKYIREHIFLIERHLGRALLPGEIVHHLNGNKQDNRLSNLRVMSSADHKRLHDFKRRLESRHYHELIHTTSH